MCSPDHGLEMAGLSDPGRRHEQNEDALLLDAEQGIVLLADGMGGYNAGEVASSLAVDRMHALLSASLPVARTRRRVGSVAATLSSAIEQANAAVYGMACSQPACAGMGSTLIAGVFCPEGVVVGHVGDSRLYRCRGAEFSRLTRDHSLLQMQIDAGLIGPDEASQASCRHLVTRAVGVEATVEPEIQVFDTRPGDIYLFCSDGLTDMLDDGLIGEGVSQGAPDLTLTAQMLVDQANAQGGRDNISLALVAVRRAQYSERGFLSRFGSWLARC